MAWTNYSQPIKILSATDINNIKENIEIIRGLLTEKGFTVGNTQDFQASESTQFIKMFDILSNIEYNLDTYDINGKNITRVFGYSRNLGNSSIYKGNKVNFNIILTYLEEDNKTNLYLGSPIVNIDY